MSKSETFIPMLYSSTEIFLRLCEKKNPKIIKVSYRKVSQRTTFQIINRIEEIRMIWKDAVLLCRVERQFELEYV